MRVGPIRSPSSIGPLRSAHVDHVGAVGRDRPARPRHHVLGPGVHIGGQSAGVRGGTADFVARRRERGKCVELREPQDVGGLDERGARPAGEDVAARATVQRRDVGAPAQRVVALIAAERDIRAPALADVAGRRRLIVAVFEAHVDRGRPVTRHAVRRVGRATAAGPNRRAGVGKDDAVVLARDHQAIRLAGIGGVDQCAAGLPEALARDRPVRPRRHQRQRTESHADGA